MKKTLSIILLPLLGVLIYFMFIRQDELIVRINNGSDKDISGLQLVTNDDLLLVDVYTIKAGEEEDYIIELPEDFDEASINVSYVDKQGNEHNEVILGYVEKGYIGNGEVSIHSIDDNGILEMTIEGETNIF
ncbi:hypothetical protein [Anaerosporobacter sp.]